MTTNSIDLLGYSVAKTTMDSLLNTVVEYIESKKPHKLVLLNPYIILEAKRNIDYDNYIKTADIVTADGVGLLIAAKLFGQYFPERVTGTDFMPAVARLAANNGYSLYLLGAAPGVAEKAAKNLVNAFPDLKIVGTQHGYFKEEEEDSIVAAIKKANPDILIVCMGVFIQEMFIERHLNELNIPLSLGNGAALDFVAGRIKRAPLWMQKRGLEWLFRLVKEPRRLWKRYLLGNIKFLVLVLIEYLRLKTDRSCQDKPSST